MSQVFDPTLCSLGEGPLWHPQRQSLFWFDINHMRIYERALDQDEANIWQFDEHVSAAGWIDAERLLIASETSLFDMNIETGESAFIVELEADNPITRSNDGRTDPLGGFWIGTMGKNAESAAGAIYRYYDGELRKLYSGITISNSICFSPEGDTAYYCDTPKRQIMKVTLDAQGWPTGQPSVHIDLREDGYNPDGSIVDSEGYLWNAQYGAGRVARYDRDGKFDSDVKFPTSQMTCPTFGGRDLSTLFATSAAQNLDDTENDNAGAVLSVETKFKGQAEYQVRFV